MHTSLKISAFIVAVVMLLGVGIGIHAAACAGAPLAPVAGVRSQSPVYCDVAALAPAERTRHFKVLGPALAAKRSAVRALTEGYEFEFPADAQTYQQLVDWIGGERACCPFLDIDVRLGANSGPILVRLTGQPGTKQFIEAEGGDWLTPIGASG